MKPDPPPPRGEAVAADTVTVIIAVVSGAALAVGLLTRAARTPMAAVGVALGTDADLVEHAATARVYAPALLAWTLHLLAPARSKTFLLTAALLPHLHYAAPRSSSSPPRCCPTCTTPLPG